MDETPFVFVSYTKADEAWATWIASALEGAGLAARVQAWDSTPGENFVEWMNQQLSGARWTVAVYSAAYFESEWCTTEWTAALGRRTLLPVRIEPVDPPETLRSITWVDLFDQDEPRARESLLRAVGLEVLPRLAEFPGRPVRSGAAMVFPGQRSGPSERLRLAQTHLRQPLVLTRLAGVRAVQQLINGYATHPDVLTAAAEILADHVRHSSVPRRIPDDVAEALIVLRQLGGIPYSLAGVHLEAVDFTDADLSGVDLTGALLLDADLTDAQLTKADLTNTQLTNANLTKAQLSEVNLRGAQLRRAKLTGADLTGARLDHANLSGARLDGANLSGARLDHADFTDAWLSMTDLRHARLTGANLTRARLYGADLTEAHGLRREQVDVALIDLQTRLPARRTQRSASRWPKRHWDYQ
jgi:uncharacterized protein YjbI with pentapeptide repeats